MPSFAATSSIGMSGRALNERERLCLSFHHSFYLLTSSRHVAVLEQQG